MLNGAQEKPALDIASTMPMASRGRLGAAAAIPSPRVAADSPATTGRRGPFRVVIASDISSAAKKPKNPRLETIPAVWVEISKTERNSGRKRPNPMRAGP